MTQDQEWQALLDAEMDRLMDVQRYLEDNDKKVTKKHLDRVRRVAACIQAHQGI